MYSHTQHSWLLFGSLLVSGLIALAGGLIAPDQFPFASRAVVVGTGGLLLLFACLFCSLKVTVDQGEVHVRFGPGLFSRRFKKSEVVTAAKVRNRWYYGWGIRLTPHGWMFNISGLDAVELHLRDGEKFRIGTDDPEGLLQALQ